MTADEREKRNADWRAEQLAAAPLLTQAQQSALRRVLLPARRTA